MSHPKDVGNGIHQGWSCHCKKCCTQGLKMLSLEQIFLAESKSDPSLFDLEIIFKATPHCHLHKHPHLQGIVCSQKMIS